MPADKQLYKVAGEPGGDLHLEPVTSNLRVSDDEISKFIVFLERSDARAAGLGPIFDRIGLALKELSNRRAFETPPDSKTIYGWGMEYPHEGRMQHSLFHEEATARRIASAFASAQVFPLVRATDETQPASAEHADLIRLLRQRYQDTGDTIARKAADALERPAHETPPASNEQLKLDGYRDLVTMGSSVGVGGAALAALLDEIDRLRRELADFKPLSLEEMREIVRAAPETSGDAADAARYRWLRDNPEHESLPYRDSENGKWIVPRLSDGAGGFGGGVGDASFDSLDKAIDFAMGGHAQKTSEVRCRAHNAMPDPTDCDWPHCGCDPKATRVLEALQEEGWQPPEKTSEQICEMAPDGETHDLRPGVVCIACWNKAVAPRASDTQDCECGGFYLDDKTGVVHAPRCPKLAAEKASDASLLEASQRVSAIALGAAGKHAERVVELEAEVSTLREHLAEVNRLLSLNVAEVERLRAASNGSDHKGEQA